MSFPTGNIIENGQSFGHPFCLQLAIVNLRLFGVDKLMFPPLMASACCFAFCRQCWSSMNSSGEGLAWLRTWHFHTFPNRSWHLWRVFESSFTLAPVTSWISQVDSTFFLPCSIHLHSKHVVKSFSALPSFSEMWLFSASPGKLPRSRVDSNLDSNKGAVVWRLFNVLVWDWFYS